MVTTIQDLIRLAMTEKKSKEKILIKKGDQLIAKVPTKKKNLN